MSSPGRERKRQHCLGWRVEVETTVIHNGFLVELEKSKNHHPFRSPLLSLLSLSLLPRSPAVHLPRTHTQIAAEVTQSTRTFTHNPLHSLVARRRRRRAASSSGKCLPTHLGRSAVTAVSTTSPIIPFATCTCDLLHPTGHLHFGRSSPDHNHDSPSSAPTTTPNRRHHLYRRSCFTRTRTTQDLARESLCLAKLCPIPYIYYPCWTVQLLLPALNSRVGETKPALATRNTGPLSPHEQFRGLRRLSVDERLD